MFSNIFIYLLALQGQKASRNIPILLLEKRHNLLEEKPAEPKKTFFFPPKTTFFTKNSFLKKRF
jgi:hypothetical protein